MHAIEVKELSKIFKKPIREEGLRGMIKALFSKKHEEVKAVDRVSFTIEEGEIVGYIGANGAGKSTTIRTLLGLISPSGGHASIFGKDIVTQKEAILAEVGYLPSEVSFYHGMTARELIARSARLRTTDCTRESARLCERLSLDTTRKIDELSLGNRKKVGIVCALQHKPRLCILDEPTSGLDPLMQKEFYTILKERNAEGTTVFLSSHVLSEVERYCQHAAVIRDGKLLVTGRVDELSHTGVKRITLRGAPSLPATHHIRHIKEENGTVSFLYDGTSTQLLALLSSLSPEDFTVSDPDLEEIFWHYYAKEDVRYDFDAS